MLRGPNGERRPADVVGCAVMVAKIATGEKSRTNYLQLGVMDARVAFLSPERRSEIAKKAASARWG